jgi:hypothetical protein
VDSEGGCGKSRSNPADLLASHAPQQPRPPAQIAAAPALVVPFEQVSQHSAGLVPGQGFDPEVHQGVPLWQRVARASHHGRMENSHGFRNFVLVVVGLFLVGVIGWWVLKALIGVFFYILLGALLVGGGIYLYGRAKKAITGGRRQIGR